MKAESRQIPQKLAARLKFAYCSLWLFIRMEQFVTENTNVHCFPTSPLQTSYLNNVVPSSITQQIKTVFGRNSTVIQPSSQRHKNNQLLPKVPGTCTQSVTRNS